MFVLVLIGILLLLGSLINKILKPNVLAIRGSHVLVRRTRYGAGVIINFIIAHKVLAERKKPTILFILTIEATKENICLRP